jgi:hypothetical protein
VVFLGGDVVVVEEGAWPDPPFGLPPGATAFDPVPARGEAGTRDGTVALLHGAVNDAGKGVVTPTPGAVETEVIEIGVQSAVVAEPSPPWSGVPVFVAPGWSAFVGPPVAPPERELVSPTAASPAEIADRT